MIGGTLDDLTALCDQLARAASKTGRTVGAYALFGIIAAATDEEAKSLAEHYLAGTDREAIANQTATADGDKGGTIGTLLGSERPMTPPVDFPDDHHARAGAGRLLHGAATCRLLRPDRALPERTRNPARDRWRDSHLPRLSRPVSPSSPSRCCHGSRPPHRRSRTDVGLPKVAFIGTGGTISSLGADSLDLIHYGDQKSMLTADQILARVPEAAAVADVVPVPFGTVPSPDMAFQQWRSSASAATAWSPSIGTSLAS